MYHLAHGVGPNVAPLDTRVEGCDKPVELALYFAVFFTVGHTTLKNNIGTYIIITMTL